MIPDVKSQGFFLYTKNYLQGEYYVFFRKKGLSP